MLIEKMELLGFERAKYFAPTVICGYLALLCVTLIVASVFLRNMPDAVAVTAAGLFGLTLSASLGLLFWRAQRHDLRFERVPTAADAGRNFAAVRAAVAAIGWRTLLEEPGRRLEARTPESRFSPGDRVSIRFDGRDVLVASIADPGVGFSLVGRRSCAEHRDFVRRLVQPS